MNLLKAGSCVLFLYDLLRVCINSYRLQRLQWLRGLSCSAGLAEVCTYRVMLVQVNASKSARQCLFSKGKILVIPRLMNNLQHVAFDDLRLQPCWFAMASGRWLQKKLRWRWLTGSNGKPESFFMVQRCRALSPWKFLEMLLGQSSQKSQALLKDYLFRHIEA